MLPLIEKAGTNRKDSHKFFCCNDVLPNKNLGMPSIGSTQHHSVTYLGKLIGIRKLNVALTILTIDSGVSSNRGLCKQYNQSD